MNKDETKEHFDKKLYYEALEMAVNNSSLLIGEYNVYEDCYISYSNNAGFFRTGERIENASKALIEKGLILKDSKKEFKRILKSVSSGAPYVQGDLHIVDKLGKKFWYNISLTSVFSPNGNSLRVIACGIDITDSKKFEDIYNKEIEYQQAILEEGYLLKARVNLTQDLVEDYNGDKLVSLSRSGKVFSEEIVKIYKMASTKELRREYKHFYDRLEILNRFNQGERQWSYEYKRKLRDKRRIWVKSSIKARKDPETGDIILFIYLENIDNEKNRQIGMDLLAARNYDYVGIADTLTNEYRNIAKTDRYGVPSDYVANYSEGMKRFAILFKDYFVSNEDFIRAKDYTSFGHLKEQLEKNEIYSYFIRIKPEDVDQEITYKMNYTYFDTEKTKILIARANVTEEAIDQLRQRNVLKKALEEEEQAVKAKSDFIERINKDIRGPLNAITGFIELSEGIDEVDELKGNLTKIKEANANLLTIIESMVDVDNNSKSLDHNHIISEFNNVKNYMLLGCRVLLCEDHPLNAEVAIKLLEKQGCIVEHAWNGAEAIDKFAERGNGGIDVILMDIQMPILNGIKATQKIRKLKYTDAKEVPIIAMTASAYAQDVEECLKAGMNYHLAKPINKEALYETIEKAIKK